VGVFIKEEVVEEVDAATGTASFKIELIFCSDLSGVSICAGALFSV
jgi:hypothetical protein